jgi:hypothetical protein
MKKPCDGGALGCVQLHRDHEYDLALDVLKKIPADSYEVIPAPWDRHKDPAAARLAEREAKAKELFAKVERLQAAIDQVGQQIEQLTADATAKQQELQKATRAADAAVADSERLAGKKQLSENEKKKLKGLQAEASRLAAIANRGGLEDQKAKGQLMVAMAEHGLLKLDLQIAERAFRRAAQEYEQLRQPKTESEDDAKVGDSETTEQAAGESAGQEPPQGD